MRRLGTQFLEKLARSRQKLRELRELKALKDKDFSHFPD